MKKLTKDDLSNWHNKLLEKANEVSDNIGNIKVSVDKLKQLNNNLK